VLTRSSPSRSVFGGNDWNYRIHPGVVSASAPDHNRLEYHLSVGCRLQIGNQNAC